jgi:hypothetical protein
MRTVPGAVAHGETMLLRSSVVNAGFCVAQTSRSESAAMSPGGSANAGALTMAEQKRTTNNTNRRIGVPLFASA